MCRPLPHFGAVYVFIHPRGLRVSNSHKVAKTERRVSHIVAHFFMDEHLGNLELLDQPLVAFFASRETPEEVAKCALKWAEQVSTTDKVVISGFHSPLEKEVLNILLEHKHPVVIVLGRTLYKRIPTQYAEPLSEGRMLIMNVRNVSRNNYRTSQLRNFVVADYADECVFAGLHKGSSLDVLYDIRLSKSRRVEEIIIVQ